MPVRAGSLLILVFLLGACGSPQSVLDPHGPAADRIATASWILFAIGAVVSLLVIGLLAITIRRSRRRADEREGADVSSAGVRRTPEAHAAERRALKWVLIGGALFPAAVIVPLFVYSTLLQGSLLPPADAELRIEIEARQWWWAVRYLDDDPQLIVTSANEVHIPVGRQVRVVLRSPDVIHSFWVPQLQGKTDMIPGRPTVTWLEADEPGVYRGQCAEYCGLQHAHMAITVIAHEPAEFDAWLARERTPAAAVGDIAAVAAGHDVFMQRGCAVCHTVRGTPARGTIGPDLTHLASRRTLAAGTLPNRRAHLMGWIANPQEIKPGNHMPRVPLAAEELHQVVAWLETLR